MYRSMDVKATLEGGGIEGIDLWNDGLMAYDSNLIL
jgi:hypothetical protein